MNTKRVYYMMLGVVCLLVIALFGSAYGVQKLLAGQSTDMLHQKAHLVALTQEQTQLAQAKNDIKTYTSLYNISKTIVPQTKDQTQAVRQIVKLADENSVKLQSITFPASSLGNAATGATNAAPATVHSSTTTLSQLAPVKNIPGVYMLQLTITSDATHYATYPQLISFLSSLEQNRQTAIVSTISISPSPDNHSLFSFIITLSIYIKP